MIAWPKVIVAAVLAAILLLAGAQIGTWRADAACATKVSSLNDQIDRLTSEKHALEMAIAEANKAIAVADAQTQAADVAKEQAQRHAAELAQFSQSRMDKLAKAFESATSCGDVLKSYWEMRK